MRPRWPDIVIFVSILALTVVGTLAIWGPELATAIRGESAGESADAPADESAAQRPSIGKDVL